MEEVPFWLQETHSTDRILPLNSITKSEPSTLPTGIAFDETLETHFSDGKSDASVGIHSNPVILASVRAWGPPNPSQNDIIEVVEVDKPHSVQAIDESLAGLTIQKEKATAEDHKIYDELFGGTLDLHSSPEPDEQDEMDEISHFTEIIRKLDSNSSDVRRTIPNHANYGDPEEGCQSWDRLLICRACQPALYCLRLS